MSWSAVFNTAAKPDYKERTEGECHGAIHAGYRFGQDDVSCGGDEPTRRGSVAERFYRVQLLHFTANLKANLIGMESSGDRIFWGEHCGRSDPQNLDPAEVPEGPGWTKLRQRAAAHLYLRSKGSGRRPLPIWIKAGPSAE